MRKVILHIGFPKNASTTLQRGILDKSGKASYVKSIPVDHQAGSGRQVEVRSAIDEAIKSGYRTAAEGRVFE